MSKGAAAEARQRAKAAETKARLDAKAAEQKARLATTRSYRPSTAPAASTQQAKSAPVRQPTVSQPVVRQPTVSQPVVRQPTVSQPVVRQPTVSKPVVRQPTTNRSTFKPPSSGPMNIGFGMTPPSAPAMRGTTPKASPFSAPKAAAPARVTTSSFRPSPNVSSKPASSGTTFRPASSQPAALSRFDQMMASLPTPARPTFDQPAFNNNLNNYIQDTIANAGVVGDTGFGGPSAQDDLAALDDARAAAAADRFADTADARADTIANADNAHADAITNAEIGGNAGGGTSARDDLAGFDQVGATLPGQVNAPVMATLPGQVNAPPPAAPPEERYLPLPETTPPPVTPPPVTPPPVEPPPVTPPPVTPPPVEPPPVTPPPVTPPPPPVTPPPVTPPPVTPPPVTSPPIAAPVTAPPLTPYSGNIPIALATSPAAFGQNVMQPRSGAGVTPMPSMMPPPVAPVPLRSGMNEFEREVLRRMPEDVVRIPTPPRFFKDGGEAIGSGTSLAEYLQEQSGDGTINTDPLGTAQQYLADVNAVKPLPTPTRRSVKRVSRGAGSDASTSKEMNLKLPALTSSKQMTLNTSSTPEEDQNKPKGTAREQMEDLVRSYELRIKAAKNRARGLSADTFGAPTLEGPSLTKNTLAKKRFAKGGEVKKPEAEVAEPSLFGVSNYATQASAKMFPDQLGQDDQRDAARHMLAAATVSRKYGPKAAELLGKAHEYTSNPQTFFSLFGIGQARDDLPYDVHNNRIGAELGSRATSQAELEKLVKAMALQAQTAQAKDKPYIMSREQMDARKAKAQKGMTERPEYRAEGSPEEGEVSQAELEAASKPAFVTPKSGKGRKRSSKAGELEAAALQGISETPYNLLGAPVDLATMALRPFGYDVQAPMLGSEDLKRRATKAGIRQEPPMEGTAARALYNLTEVGSSAVNPTAPVRAGMKAAKAVGDKATDVAKDFQQYNRQLDVPGASYAVRPTGSTMLTGPVGLENNVSEVDQLLNKGRSGARGVAGQNVDQEELIAQFWDKKARNYFTRQFGTPDDPIAAAISKKQIKGTALEEVFPEYMLDQIAAGKTRVNEKGQERFFPKYPRAMEDFTSRYDKATGIKGNLVTSNPAAADREYNLLSSQGRAMGRSSADAEADKLIGQGLRPELINTNVGAVTRSVKDTDRVLSDGTESARGLLGAFEEASAYRKMTPEQQTEWANTQFGNGRRLHGMNEEEIGQNLLGENVRTAIEKGEPVYDIGYMGKPLSTLFKPDNINQYLASLPLRELANVRFEDAVRGGLKLGDNQLRLENIAERIKSGKPVADTVFSQGVSGPLLQFGEGSGLDGFAWKRIEKREATVPEGAYVGHSVGGYELGGATYTRDKRDGFNTGQWQVYTLRDNRNRPVNTIEVKMLDETTPVVTQIKGNGRSTGNTAPEKYDGAVLRFLQDYLKPAAIEESDSYLTPLLQNYKTELGTSPRLR